MTDGRPAWSRESKVLRLADRVDVEDFSPDWAFGGSTGREVRVAVIDSGIDADHPALGGCVDEAGSIEFVADRSGSISRHDGPHRDVYGHGTACAGIIHALAPEASITSVRVLDEGLRGKAAAFHAGLSWAVDEGFDVINLSLGAARREWALAFHDTCDRGYFTNSFIVTAANNVHRDSFPSLFASVTSVAANNSADPLRFHYNPEPPTEFLARGIDVDVPWLDGTTITTTGNSFAAPHIAGFAALIKAKHPQLRPFQVKTALWAASANVRESAPLERPGRWGTIRLTRPATLGLAPSVGLAPDRRRDDEAPTAAAGASAAGAAVRPMRPRSLARPRAGTASTAADDDTRAEIQDMLVGCDVGGLVERGPWGPVYAATVDGRPVLVRRLDAGLAADRRTRARFGASVRIAAGLSHPHLVPVLKFCEHDSFALVVTPRHRATLAGHSGTDPVDPAVGLAVVLAVLRGLHPAHAAGIYHGDLHPGCVVVGGDDDRIMVADVGIAAALTSDIRTTNAPNDPLSWSHLAPEQFDGAAVGAFTDIHAVGLLGFGLLSGALPYEPVADLGGLVRQRAATGPRPIRTLAPWLDPAVAATIDRAVATDPARRHRSVGELGAELRAAADQSLGPGWLDGLPFGLLGAAPWVPAQNRASASR